MRGCRSRDAIQRAAYSEQTAELIDQEVAKLIADAPSRVFGTLNEKRATSDALAHLLLEHEVVERPILAELLGRKPDDAPASDTPSGTPAAPVAPRPAVAGVGSTTGLS